MSVFRGTGHTPPTRVARRALAAKRATHELGRILLARLGHDPYGYDHLKRKPIRYLWPMLYRGYLAYLEERAASR